MEHCRASSPAAVQDDERNRFRFEFPAAAGRRLPPFSAVQQLMCEFVSERPKFLSGRKPAHASNPSAFRVALSSVWKTFRKMQLNPFGP